MFLFDFHLNKDEKKGFIKAEKVCTNPNEIIGKYFTIIEEYGLSICDAAVNIGGYTNSDTINKKPDQYQKSYQKNGVNLFIEFKPDNPDMPSEIFNDIARAAEKRFRKELQKLDKATVI